LTAESARADRRTVPAVPGGGSGKIIFPTSLHKPQSCMIFSPSTDVAKAGRASQAGSMPGDRQTGLFPRLHQPSRRILAVRHPARGFTA